MKRTIIGMILVIILSISGCTAKASSPVASSQKGSSKISSAVIFNEESMKSDKTVKAYVKSHSGEKLAVLQVKDGAGQALIVNLGDGKTKAVPNINDDDLRGVAWSYDDKYLSINAGTGIMGETYIVDAASGGQIYSTGDTGRLWASGSDKIAFAQVNKTVPQNILTELDGSVEITVYDLSTLNKETVLKADSALFYRLKSWNADGLCVQKTYNKRDKPDETVLLDTVK